MKLRTILLLPILMMVSGCLGNLSSDGIFSTLSSTGVGVATTVVAGPIPGVIAGVAAGVATDAAVSSPETTSDILETIPEDQRADVLKHQKLYEAIEHIGLWLILGGIFVIFILPLLVGWINSAIKGRKSKNEMITIKERLFDHPDIKMRDLS